MKILILIIAFMTLVTCWKPIRAAEISFQATQMSRDADDDMFQVGGWEGFQVSYMPGTDVYYFISKESMAVIPKGKAWETDMTGIGIGKKFNLTKGIRLFGQLGYYFVKNDWGERRREFNEGLHYYCNDRWIHSDLSTEYHFFDEFGVEQENTIGGTIGLEMMHKLSKYWSVSFIASYRMMKIKERTRCYSDKFDYEGTGGVWEFHPNRNYSSTNFALGVNYEF